MKRSIVLLALPAVLLFAQAPMMGMGGERPMMNHPMMMERPMMGQGFEEMIEQLGLDDKAVEKAQDLWYAHQKEMLDLGYQMKKARLELSEYVSSGKFTIDGIIKRWKNIQALKDRIEEKKMDFKVSIFKLIPKDKQKDYAWWLIGDRRGMIKKRVMKVMEQRRMMKHK